MSLLPGDLRSEARDIQLDVGPLTEADLVVALEHLVQLVQLIEETEKPDPAMHSRLRAFKFSVVAMLTLANLYDDKARGERLKRGGS